MGIKQFYGYCLKNIPDCARNVDIKEEIKNCTDEKPKIMINLHTLTYHFKIKKEDLLCGYQLNKIKFIVEKFFQQLIDCGAELIFVFEKSNANDQEFLTRRSDDYKNAHKLLKNIEKIQEFDKLLEHANSIRKYPFNVLITLCMIQSAEKFGKVYGFDNFKYPSAIAMGLFANEENCKWILGLSTLKFLVPGNWKIWSDEKLDIKKMKVLEINKKAILKHFQIKYEHASLFYVLSDKLECEENAKKKVTYFFGSKSKFESVARFIRDLKFPLTEEEYVNIATKIFGQKYEPQFIEDLKKSIEKYSVEPKEPLKPGNVDIDEETMKLIQNDFINFADAILFNQKPIFISPVFMDLNSPDMENFNSLVLPWIQKTAGILLKNSSDTEIREIVMLEDHAGNYQKFPLEPIYPDFEVPSLKSLLNGELSTFDKMKILFWIMDFNLSEIEIPCMTEEYTVDCMILIYLIKKNSLTILDARCILKTLVDARTSAVTLDYSTDYPKKVNSRALRCTFLYSKMYFILHSCLACFGMKNFCPELKFDGVYFQKMYSLNVLNEPEDEEENDNVIASANIANTRDAKPEPKEKYEEPIIPNDKEFDQTEIVDLFARIIRI